MNRKITLVAALCLSLPLLQGCVVPVLVAGGIGSTVLVAQDRRSSAALLEDQTLEAKIHSRLNEAFNGQNNSHITVTSYNRRILLTGEVFDQMTRERVNRIVRNTPNVREVLDQLTIQFPSTLNDRAFDLSLTAKVKAQYVAMSGFPASAIKIHTDRRAVYLMGLVTREEARWAAELASSVAGLEKVVPYFEFVEADPNQIDRDIEKFVNQSLQNRFGAESRIQTTVNRRRILLTGEVMNEAARAEAVRLAQQTPQVDQVYDEMAVSGLASPSMQYADRELAASVHQAISRQHPRAAQFISVVASRGIVYLLGSVTPEEAAVAAQAAGGTPGVLQLKTFFKTVAEEVRYQ